MPFEFMRDPKWRDLDRDTKDSVIGLAFDKKIASDPKWPELPAEKQEAVRSLYFQKAQATDDDLATPEDRSAMGSIGAGLVHGTYGLLESAGTAMQYAGKRTGIETLSEFGKDTSDYWEEKAKKYGPSKDIAGKNLWDNPELLADSTYWLYNVSDMVPFLASTLIPGGVAVKGLQAIPKLARFATLGGAVAGGAFGGGMEAAQTYKAVLAKGGTEPEAARAGELMWAGAGVLNAIGVGKILPKAAGKFKDKVIKHLGAAAWEGLTEAAEEPTEVFSKYFGAYLADEPLPEDLRGMLVDSLKDALTVAPIAGVAGGGASLLTGGVGDTTTPPPSITDAPDADAAIGAFNEEMGAMLDIETPGEPAAGLLQPEAPTLETVPEDQRDVRLRLENQAAIDLLANEAATSPENELGEPTDPQKMAGNYKKGPIPGAAIGLPGKRIMVENPRGSTRTETKPEDAGEDWAPSWATEVKEAHYGYFSRTMGKDGDQIDVWVASPFNLSKNAYVVDQIDPETGEFDEHKTLIGFETEEAAKRAYMANYEEGWQGLGAITEMPMEQFNEWIGDGTRKTQALKYQKGVTDASTIRGDEGQVLPGEAGLVEEDEQVEQGPIGGARAPIQERPEKGGEDIQLEEPEKPRGPEGVETDEEHAVIRSMNSMEGSERRQAEMQAKPSMSDDEIKEWLKYEFGLGGGQSSDRLGFIEHKGGANPVVSWRSRDKPTEKIGGKKLINLVRKIFNLPKEGEEDLDAQIAEQERIRKEQVEKDAAELERQREALKDQPVKVDAIGYEGSQVPAGEMQVSFHSGPAKGASISVPLDYEDAIKAIEAEIARREAGPLTGPRPPKTSERSETEDVARETDEGDRWIEGHLQTSDRYDQWWNQLAKARDTATKAGVTSEMIDWTDLEAIVAAVDAVDNSKLEPPKRTEVTAESLVKGSEKKAVFAASGVKLYNTAEEAQKMLDEVGERGADERMADYLLKLHKYQVKNPPAEITDTIEVEVEETGETVTLQRDAHEALAEAEQERAKYTALLECLST